MVPGKLGLESSAVLFASLLDVVHQKGQIFDYIKGKKIHGSISAQTSLGCPLSSHSPLAREEEQHSSSGVCARVGERPGTKNQEPAWLTLRSLSQRRDSGL